MVPNVGEPVVVYTGNENNPNIVTEGRDDIRHAISGEELLDRLCPPRIFLHGTCIFCQMSLFDEMIAKIL